MAKGFKLLKKKNKRLLMIGGAVVAAWFFLRKKTSPLVEMEPAKVEAGQLVSVESYRVIERRDGFQYEPVTKGSAGSLLEFTPSVSGLFTRNVIDEGGQLWAEIKT